MEVGKYRGTPVDQLPNSYLRWMVRQSFPEEYLEAARRKLGASQYDDTHIEVSRHAMDMYSTRHLVDWITATNGETGIGTHVAKLANEAWDKGVVISKKRTKDDGIVKRWNGVDWVFSDNNEGDLRSLITVY